MRRQFPPTTRFLRSFPLTLVRALAQHEFLDLTGRGLGQLAEHHIFRPLEPGHLAAAPVEELFGADILAGLQLDKGAGHLAPFLVRLGDNRRRRHRRVTVEIALTSTEEMFSPPEMITSFSLSLIWM